MSGYQDSNLGPPAPKAGALTGLRYTPRSSVGKPNVAVVFLRNCCKGKQSFESCKRFVIFLQEKRSVTENI